MESYRYNGGERTTDDYLTPIDHFRVGDAVTVQLSDAAPFAATVEAVEVHRYSDREALLLGKPGYVRYSVRWGARPMQGGWVFDDAVS